MSSHQNDKNPSQLKDHASPSQEDYFDIVKNYSSRRQISLNSSAPIPQITKSIIKKDKSVRSDTGNKNSIKKKEKGQKKYSVASQEKRQIASRHIDRMQKDSEEWEPIKQWKQLWKCQIQQFIKSGDYEAAKIFEDDAQQSLIKYCLPQEKREMVQILPKDSPTFLQKQSHIQSIGKSEINHQQLLFSDGYNYQSCLYNQIQHSQDLFFEDIARASSY